MKQVVHLIIIICIALLTLAGCGGNKSVRQVPHLGNTPYQQDSMLVTYATNPVRALNLLDVNADERKRLKGILDGLKDQ